MASCPKILAFTTRRLVLTRFQKPVSYLRNSPFRSFSATRIKKGGAIAWALRLSTGQEYRMTRWTNIFPLITTNDAFLAEKPEAVHASIEEWLELKEDHERNEESGSHKFPMSGFYAPFNNKLCPNEYGFIFTDFVTKRIIACTNYCSFFDEALTEFDALEAEAKIKGIDDEIAKFDTEEGGQRRWLRTQRASLESGLREYQRVKGFFDAGRLHTFQHRSFESVVVDPADFASYDEFVGEVIRRTDDAVKQDDQDRYSGIPYVSVEPPPGWQAEEFHHPNVEEQETPLHGSKSWVWFCRRSKRGISDLS
ncbi:hypothetical protein BU16DRAFT_527339 [Lophium mytilinum]|uniref:Uncharacterized protein n=1 Tax=Lophium mytilinum TaxID=390894 RepID=A0A6A6QSP5_9PEZI|nr:hypothetical protein BU16DRAFT_527339 [Lophium mytilinum]